MLMGADRRAAAEFSFWLAMPTMVGAFAYDLYKSGAHLSGDNKIIIAVGFATSFVFGWIVVKTFLGYVSRHGFGLFAWWRVRSSARLRAVSVSRSAKIATANIVSFSAAACRDCRARFR